ncbi:ABC transporter substrate-binding protein [Nakamurella leprariae]|uniref:Iron-siderophore ABC transporter substrate-binding protein n=1 Tax=Nakamurella leprariae TaxID=2803911 RepID=A0A938YBA6_9ACTN|nr:iron-siderophore ABC transporter substrate-binding protein [Nakamurella leprariae]MBM9469366.1 iron-siderophore ABC transporter substrate-binding protein [Nakamurella leprariae]
MRPRVSSRLSRSRVASLLVAVSAGMALTACGGGSGAVEVSVSDPDAGAGTGVATAAERTVVGADEVAQQVPGEPRQVVTLSEPTLDAAIALGVTPVGTVAARGQSGVAAYLAGEAAEVPIVGAVAQPNLEQIALIAPDLILVDGTSVNNAPGMMEALRGIAPTVMTGYAGGDWRANLALTAEALGREDEEQQVLDAYQDRVDDIRSRLGDQQDAQISVVRAQSGGFSLILKELLAGQVLTDLGLPRPPDQDREGRGHSEPISEEQLSMIDGDWIFMGTLGGSSVGNPNGGGASDQGAAQREIDEAAASIPGFTSLRAYQEGHIVPVDGSAWTSTGGPLLLNTILDDIDAALTQPS